MLVFTIAALHGATLVLQHHTDMMSTTGIKLLALWKV